jgi:hypothetical protein
MSQRLPTFMDAQVKLVELSECVCTKLAETGRPVCWCGVLPGLEVGWDYCTGSCDDACGMGWVRTAGINPYQTFPIPEIDNKCRMPLGFAIEIGAMRCWPVPSDGEPVDPETATQIALNQVADAQALYEAIKCCGIEIAVQQYVPSGPQAGCVGGYWLAFMAAG